MPDNPVALVTIALLAAIVGGFAGYLLRGRRSIGEKAAISESWQSQLEAQRAEQKRLVAQNKSLMEQVGQLKASGTDATNRARELSAALKEAFERRDDLQRQIKDIRSSLETAVAQRDQLRSDLDAGPAEPDPDVLREKDDKIFRLSRELENWQDRLPPLIERFRVRNEEANELERELASARERIASLESMLNSDETRVEPIGREHLPASGDASNDGAEETPVAPRHADADEDEEEDVAGESRDHNGAPNPGSLRDNLRMIKGVGPAIEKTLNELGIFRFQQVAEMSDYDIERIAKRLKGFQSRIEREDWIGQARHLHERKTAGQLDVTG